MNDTFLSWFIEMSDLRIANDPLIKGILNLYSHTYDIPIVLVYNNSIVWQTSEAYCSPFCRLLNNLHPNLCKIDHLERAKLTEAKVTLCHAGLWNYVVPIKQGGKFVGALLTGQRRLSGKEKESFDIIKKFKSLLSEDDYSKLEKSYYDTPIIPGFKTQSLEDLKFIEERLYDIFDAQDLNNKKILNLAHELLLPMQSMVANAENLQEDLMKSKSEFAFKAEEILTQILKLGLIVDNIRSSLQGIQKETYRFEYHSINELISEMVSIFKYEAELKNIKINVDMDQYKIPMAKQHLNRAFFNLIHNAIKYSYSGSAKLKRSVDIVGKKKEDHYHIIISNFGIGILEKEKEKIFQEGYRGELSSDRERTGSGIGLSEAKKIIENHGGSIIIESTLTGTNKYSDPYKTNVHVILKADIHGRF